jgi:hypothetical protein
MSCLSARDWRAAEASLQVPALARFGVHHTKGSRRSGDRDENSARDSKSMPDDGRKVVKAEKG